MSKFAPTEKEIIAALKSAHAQLPEKDILTRGQIADVLSRMPGGERWLHVRAVNAYNAKIVEIERDSLRVLTANKDVPRDTRKSIVNAFVAKMRFAAREAPEPGACPHCFFIHESADLRSDVDDIRLKRCEGKRARALARRDDTSVLVTETHDPSWDLFLYGESLDAA